MPWTVRHLSGRPGLLVFLGGSPPYAERGRGVREPSVRSLVRPRCCPTRTAQRDGAEQHAAARPSGLRHVTVQSGARHYAETPQVTASTSGRCHHWFRARAMARVTVRVYRPDLSGSDVELVHRLQAL